LLPFGADRAILIAGPLGVDGARAGREFGWRATRGSADVLSAALLPGDDRHSPEENT
jgi:hypothetical protein